MMASAVSETPAPHGLGDDGLPPRACSDLPADARDRCPEQATPVRNKGGGHPKQSLDTHLLSQNKNSQDILEFCAMHGAIVGYVSTCISSMLHMYGYLLSKEFVRANVHL